MARKKTTSKKTTAKASKPFQLPNLKLNRLQEVIVGSALIVVGLLLLFSFISYLFTGAQDQSVLVELGSRSTETKNWISQLGAWLGHTFVYKGFGIPAFSISVLTMISGIFLFATGDKVFSLSRKRISNLWFWGLLLMLWLSIFLGFFHNTNALLGGKVGYELNDFLQDYLGLLGAILVMFFIAIVYVVLRLKLTPELITAYFSKKATEVKEGFENIETTDEESDWEKATVEGNPAPDIDQTTAPATATEEPKNTVELSDDAMQVTVPEEETVPEPVLKKVVAPKDENDIGMEIEQTLDEEEVIDNKANKLVEDFGEFDPTLELSNFQFPPLDLLKDYTKGKTITINEEELQANKDRIVETLKNYKIGIAKISATVGPTVTLYEIVPEAGIRISKIKNLEDDIALSLAALGIRIIAPIPGKGTIGIEVPNQNPSIVSMRSVVASPKFQNAEMELPIAFGKTISNETFVVDLAKMPHLLMAGATGQGKSVGLNAILTSLLYSKHPAEVKFVLVDPKKVELTLFNKIERHYLAKLPDSEEAIITDNSKVINTLNSLCIEMDQRYDILKDAMCRNLKEYNAKFKARKLNPANGHKFLPYIVLVVDEFADLIMTAGKEVETPIARLAQLARAIGIHLIIATQRPSVNVITGMIKANFPARISFRVMQKVDSRTILDSGGADQLIGRGDMLYTAGNELIRIQCAFVDTPEVEKITDFIGNQKAYPDAHILPEYVGEDGGTSIDNNIDERDAKFRDAAEIIVIAQQGSASLLQRKLKLGYNRAGRIIDQLEAAGIVGGFEGSKARQVLIPDLTSLEVFLNEEQNK
ncbi:S-DNA-T family DNA segregation ATPase FtsK/SpoIIIE [Nonlabens xylanidelens]|uniref:S-DNA-T family DNA segregation ATPase FtsK/SpoIIIE n=1 Tax=Nonlabens xylanidelens TaxID=191564 RepID=A0A2S6IGE7_9FLAO|nr:DNA translocase FtsK [Nonlabens xylanidelens]PPK93289.1 S-DNA-T family DNA segregation ATPase FtsK/SpoIIIE [Nonlabens xylanidelens]PQJ20891.1 cell division protein FtsK [Nonlabens xylanidelens]